MVSTRPARRASRPAQPTSTPTSRLSRVARNERPESKPLTPGSQTRPQLPGHSHHGFDTTSSQSEQACSTNFHPHKPVEPGREERATRVETTRKPRSRPNHSHHGFRHDRLADAREDRLNRLWDRSGGDETGEDQGDDDRSQDHAVDEEARELVGGDELQQPGDGRVGDDSGDHGGDDRRSPAD